MCVCVKGRNLTECMWGWRRGSPIRGAGYESIIVESPDQQYSQEILNHRENGGRVTRGVGSLLRLCGAHA